MSAESHKVRAPRPAGHVSHRPSRNPGGRLATVALIVVALALIGGGATTYLWWTQWRQITVSVNGEEVRVHPDATIASLLSEHDYFGVKAGRLLSINGNVIDAAGGERCAVERSDRKVSYANLDKVQLGDHDKLKVTDGADVTEGSHVERRRQDPQVKKDGHGAVQYVSQWGKAGEKDVQVGERSGETIDKQVITAAQDMVVTGRNPVPQDGGKYVALTFDDGPSSYTQPILDVLKDKGAVATFFNLGDEMKKSPELSKAVVAGGNELASHTNTHQDLPKLDRDALRQEISSALDTLASTTGVKARMIRAPYGAFTPTEWARSGDLISCNVLWNVDTLDWKRPGADAIKNEVLSNVRNGSIVLMHDGGGNRSQDVEALPAIIDELRAQGYQLVTVGELMRLDGGFPADVVAGTVQMPEDAVLPEL